MTAPILAIPTANGRYYQHPSNPIAVPSITNIIDQKNKPGLKYWAAKMCATYAGEAREKLAGLTKDEVFQLVKNAPFAQKDDSPSAIGDIVHSWIDEFVKATLNASQVYTPPNLETAPWQAKHMWNQFLTFTGRYNPTFIDSEFTVWSNAVGYAGTADLIFKIGDVTVLADTKTGERTYPETAMQLAALANADFILTPEGEEKPMYKADRYAILHVRPRSFALIPVEKIDEAWTCFRALRAVFEWHVSHADSTLGYAPRIGSKEAA